MRSSRVSPEARRVSGRDTRLRVGLPSGYVGAMPKPKAAALVPRLLVANTALFLMFFGAWMVADYQFVRGGQNPEALRWDGLLVAAPPGIALAVNLVMVGAQPRRWWIAGGMAFLHMVLLVAAILLVGVPFHFWIGGSC